VALSRCKSLVGLVLMHRVTANMFTKFVAQIAPINEECDRLRALPKWRVWLADHLAAAAAAQDT